MHIRAIRHAAFLAILVTSGPGQAQDPSGPPPPIPVELTAVTRYASSNVTLSRKFDPESRFGLFHLNTLVVYYDRAREDDISMQNLLFFEPIEHFRLTAGFFYGSTPGLNATVGGQYVNASRNWFVLLSPRASVEADPSYSVFTIARYSANRQDRFGLYASVQGLNSFDAAGHIRSYQWVRLGLDAGTTQFGLAVNLDEAGPSPDVKSSLGLFVRREVF